MSEPDTHQVDLCVIGAGSGGVRTARTAAALGARVVIVESARIGGTCINAGCVPKKLLVQGSQYGAHFKDAAGFGWTVPPTAFDWTGLRTGKDTEIARLNAVYTELLEGSGVHILHGQARLVDGHRVQVSNEMGDQFVHARYIVIATGSTPFVPEFPGRASVITSDQAFHLPALPSRAVVVGGGYIGVEFAGIFQSLGVHTTLVHRGTLPLRNFDHEIAAFVANEMRKAGMTLRSDTDVTDVAANPDASLRVTLHDGQALDTDLVLYATGRRPRTDDLGLEAVGVSCDSKGSIKVDHEFRTSVPSIFALGDVIGRVQLTPVALAEGMALARLLFAGQPVDLDYEHIATAVFCQPSIGTVGLTEKQARERHGSAVRVFRSEFRPLKHTLSGSNKRMLMKIIVQADNDRVLGVHVAGDDAGEIVQGFAVAVRMGATKADLDRTIGIHPTAAEELVSMREPAAST